MLAGKWISKMFDPDVSQNTMIDTGNNTIKPTAMLDYDRYSYEFLADLHFEEFAKIMSNYMSKLCKSIMYVSFGNDGKVKSFVYSTKI
jgi:hypothetical protein